MGFFHRFGTGSLLVALSFVALQCQSSSNKGGNDDGGFNGDDGGGSSGGGGGQTVSGMAPTCPAGGTTCGANTCCPADHPVCCPNLRCGTDMAACGGDAGTDGGSSTVGPVLGQCSNAYQCMDGSCCPNDYPVCCAGVCAADQCPGGQLPMGVVKGPRCGEMCARASGSALHYTYNCGSLGSGSKDLGYDSGYGCGVASNDPNDGVSFTESANVNGVAITALTWNWGDYVMGAAPNGIVPPETCGDYTSSKRFISTGNVFIYGLLVELPTTTFSLDLNSSLGCSFWVCAECDYLDDKGQPAVAMSAGFTCPSVSGCSVQGTVLAGGCSSTDRNLCQGNPSGG